MKAVIQRVRHARVLVGEQAAGAIGPGFLILLGVAQDDTQREAELLAGKIARLRVMEDDEGKMNRALTDCGGAALVVSQFTLLADIKKGNRPAFTHAAPPGTAAPLYEYFCDCLRQAGVTEIATGVFGADMQVTLQNDGPVTILMDTDIWRNTR
ncbi:MAG: D-tyrosyl-tRNA(Tyr) deacylase [Oscillospiraceae bacterium]|jgi:D-tyrosyl-tRNA(Tyr) deacylase|nr:D-tyrosyl-tRNA(Tyr) deacylase [Oscillospiraceae bacterium]